ncbi:LysR family transcriptional regulator [Alteromonas sp. LMIT006]|jgi:DNA-binding transcriptional LysR family regulator|uniref:LysR family transcriptional regulator n=1 Tax=Alteromonadaceae TaxID=72275 RepID=UPI0020CA2E47|nr:LysR family transcriptional regulator [Alteromonas sp. LMIT006]UTP72371.1 LysR family transcriptional regulator [Alteromonas sp. LMIT006]
MSYRPKTTLEQWRILQAVVDYDGYAKAAQALNKSQSSLNHAVAKLQSVLGVQLLEIRGRKAYLTEAGEVMLRRSRYLTENVESLENLAENINQEWEPEITLAVDLAFDRNLLYPALQQFIPESRGSRLKIIDTVLTGTIDAITEHWADLVISHQVPVGYLGEPLVDMPFVAVCHPQHAIARMPSPIDAEALMQHCQIVIKDTSNKPQEQSGWLRSENRWTVSQFDTAIDLLLQQIGFCWLPLHKVSKYIENDELYVLNINGSTHKRLSSYLITPQPDNIGPGTRLLSDLILAQKQISIA